MNVKQGMGVTGLYWKISLWISESMVDKTFTLVWLLIGLSSQITKLRPCFTFIPKTGVGLPKRGVSFYWARGCALFRDRAQMFEAPRKIKGCRSLSLPGLLVFSLPSSGAFFHYFFVSFFIFFILKTVILWTFLYRLFPDFKLTFNFTLNTGYSRELEINSKRRLNSGEWQKIWIDYNEHHVRFMINTDFQMVDLKPEEEFGPFEGSMFIGGAPE